MQIYCVYGYTKPWIDSKEAVGETKKCYKVQGYPGKTRLVAKVSTYDSWFATPREAWSHFIEKNREKIESLMKTVGEHNTGIASAEAEIAKLEAEHAT